MQEQSGPEYRLYIEAELIRLWSKALKADRLGVDEDFFEAGGDSLLAADLIVEIERVAGRPVPATAIFEFPTIRELTTKLADDLGR